MPLPGEAAARDWQSLSIRAQASRPSSASPLSDAALVVPVTNCFILAACQIPNITI